MAFNWNVFIFNRSESLYALIIYSKQMSCGNLESGKNW